MALEDLTGTKYLDSLNSSNPVGSTDPVSDVDGHLRGVKNVLLLTFPNLTGAMTCTQGELNVLDGVTAGTVTASKGLVVDANADLSGIRNLTLTGNLSMGDSDTINLGAANDLTLAHNGADSVISNDTGILYLQELVNSNIILMQSNNSGGTTKDVARLGGATPFCRLYTDGTEKFRTDADGVSVGQAATTGDVIIDVAGGRTGNGLSEVRLIGDATYTAGGLVLQRTSSGANAPSNVIHRGTGSLTIETNEAADVVVRTTDTDRWHFKSGGGLHYEGLADPGAGGINASAIQIAGESVLSQTPTVGYHQVILGVNAIYTDVPLAVATWNWNYAGGSTFPLYIPAGATTLNYLPHGKTDSAPNGVNVRLQHSGTTNGSYSSTNSTTAADFDEVGTLDVSAIQGTQDSITIQAKADTVNIPDMTVSTITMWFT